MLVVIPLIALILMVLLFNRSDWREATLSGTIVWGVFLTIATEFLSLFRILNFTSILAIWGLLTIGLGILYYRQARFSQPNLIWKNPEQLLKNHNLSLFLILLLCGVFFITAVVGLIAFVAPPNTWDSMTYHMSRVVHWMQNQSVIHYPTYNLPQLFHPPFAEFVILHLQVLSGSDRFANFVQWFSMIGSIIGVSLIAKQLGADVRGQVFAAVFCATIPMGILQASSTQNDYAVAFWLVCLAYYVLVAVNLKDKRNPAFFIGSSIGLAVLTKSSSYIFGFPFMVWFGLVKLKRLGWKSWQSFSVVTGLFVVININHYWRNLDLFGSLMGAPKNFSVEYRMEVLTWPAVLSNIVRNLSLHNDIIRYLGLDGFITPLTGYVATLIQIIHKIIGVDMNDPRTTWGNYTVPGVSFDENTAGNPLHLLIIFSLILYLIISRNQINNRYSITYILTIGTAFLLFCIIFKIQTYQSRHHLSLFVLLAAWVGVVLSQILNYRLVNAIAVIMLVTSMPWVFQNKWRPIAAEANIFNMTRIQQYFINREHLEKPYVDAANFVLSKNCTSIGLSLGTGVTVGNRYWEYPLWPLLQQNQQVRMEHVNPQNISNEKSQVYPFNTFTPCAIISVREKSIPEYPIDQIEFNRVSYVREWSGDSNYISVLMNN